MHNWTKSEFIQLFAKWIGHTKTPYSTERVKPNEHIEVRSVHSLSGLQSKVKIQHLNHQTLEVSFIHQLSPLAQISDTALLHQELQQFNHLMESVKFPAFVWQCTHTQGFELHWQERLGNTADLLIVQQLFEQSFQLANSLCNRLCAQLSAGQSHTLAH